MAKADDPTPSLTVGELDANYPLYCQVTRILAREGNSVLERLAQVDQDAAALRQGSLDREPCPSIS